MTHLAPRPSRTGTPISHSGPARGASISTPAGRNRFPCKGSRTFTQSSRQASDPPDEMSADGLTNRKTWSGAPNS